MEKYLDQPLNGLYGSQLKRENAVGYCKKHCGHLSIAMLKKHECLKKHCNALKKHEDNPFWEGREKIKAEKKKKKGM